MEPAAPVPPPGRHRRADSELSMASDMTLEEVGGPESVDAADPHHPAHRAAMQKSLSLSDLACLELSTLATSFLLFRLALRLWSFLGMGWRWTLNLYRLIIYAVLLMPGFLQMIVFYFFSPRVVRSVPYGHGPRQRLDLYFPPRMESDQQYPVVAYVTGGAWTIGYKAWGALLARRMSKHGVIVACLDYRNFPQGDAAGMLEDVNTGVAWVCERIAKYQGDPSSITLVGQSAGAHLACLALIKQAQAQAACASAASPCPCPGPARARAPSSSAASSDDGADCERPYGGADGCDDGGSGGAPATAATPLLSGSANGNGNGNGGAGALPFGATPAWSPRRLRAFVGVSGAYDLDGLAEHLHRRGLYRGLFAQIMSLDGRPAYRALSPLHAAASLRRRGSAGSAGRPPLPPRPRQQQQHAAAAALLGSSDGDGDCCVAACGSGGAMVSAFSSAAGGGSGGGGYKAWPQAQAQSQAQALQGPSAGELLPRVYLIHGTSDKSVPHDGSVRLNAALLAAGATSCVRLFEGKGHTSFLLEDPMTGGRDLLMDLILEAVTGAEQAHSYAALCPRLLCALAGWVCPF